MVQLAVTSLPSSPQPGCGRRRSPVFTDRVDTKALGTEHAELNPELVALVRIAGVAEGRPASLREISAELGVRGFINERGNPYSASSINSML